MAKKQYHVQQKQAQKLALAEKKLAIPPMEKRFPQVSGITVRLTYYSDMTDAVLMVRTVNYFPSSSADFHMNCMIKECNNGGFNLTRKIRELIKNNKKSGKGDMLCKGGKGTLPSDHASMSYEVTVQYQKKRKTKK
jgi:hypothetical protein